MFKFRLNLVLVHSFTNFMAAILENGRRRGHRADPEYLSFLNEEVLSQS